MESIDIYALVVKWLREHVEGDEDYIVSLAICDIDTDIRLEHAKYGWPVEETDGYLYKEEGATHLVRFLVAGTADLVDGDDFYFRVDNGEFILVNEPDRPALCGEYLDEGMKWVAERALRHASSLHRTDL